MAPLTMARSFSCCSFVASISMARCLYAAIGAVLDAGRVEHPAHEAAAVPVLLADGARSDCAGQPGSERDGCHK